MAPLAAPAMSLASVAALQGTLVLAGAAGRDSAAWAAWASPGQAARPAVVIAATTAIVCVIRNMPYSPKYEGLM